MMFVRLKGSPKKERWQKLRKKARVISAELKRFLHWGVRRSQDDLCRAEQGSSTGMSSLDDFCEAKRFPHRWQKLQKEARGAANKVPTLGCQKKARMISMETNKVPPQSWFRIAGDIPAQVGGGPIT